MADYHWICHRCNTRVEKASTPNNAACPTGGGHQWHRVAEVGDQAFQCAKCRQLVRARALPSNGGCAGGGGHQWKRL